MIRPRHVFAARMALRDRIEESNVEYTPESVDRALNRVDRVALQYACEESGTPMNAMPNTKIGDGTILNAILEFLRSPQGQAIIDALLKALLHLLVPV